MRILIITFTGGVNPGTFMQALGVKTAMTRIFPDAEVDYLNFPDFKRGKGIGAKGKHDGLVNLFLQKGFAAYRLLKYKKLRKENFNYTRVVNLFNYSSADEQAIKNYDLVVIGSDTILEKAFGENGRIGLNWMPVDVPKIYFAASASPANFTPSEELSNVASRAKFIGLRDLLTINFFKERLHIDEQRLVRQPDPSYYLDIKSFELGKHLLSKLHPQEKYALYDFNSDFPLRKELADMIRSCGYKVVATAYNPYADICFDTIDAKEWAGVFPHMNIIVTERFHDSVFGLRNCKPVIAIDWDSNRFSADGDSKTLRILQDYGLEKCHFNLAKDHCLDQVEKAIRSVESDFNSSAIAKINEQIYDRANNILMDIKSKLS